MPKPGNLVESSLEVRLVDDGLKVRWNGIANRASGVVPLSVDGLATVVACIQMRRYSVGRIFAQFGADECPKFIRSGTC